MKQASTALKVFASFNFAVTFLYTLPGLSYYALILGLGVLTKSEELKHYGLRCMVAPDQWWNAALLGEEDETVSSRLGRALASGRPKEGAKALAAVVNAFFRVLAGQENHCLESIEPKYYMQGAPTDERWDFIKAPQM